MCACESYWPAADYARIAALYQAAEDKAQQEAAAAASAAAAKEAAARAAIAAASAASAAAAAGAGDAAATGKTLGAGRPADAALEEERRKRLRQVWQAPNPIHESFRHSWFHSMYAAPLLLHCIVRHGCCSSWLPVYLSCGFLIRG